MNTTRSGPRLWLIALCSLIVAGTGAVSWKLHREDATRQSIAGSLRDEQAQLKQRLLALDQRRAALQRELTEATAARAAAENSLSPVQRQRQTVLAAISTLRETAAMESSAPKPRRHPTPSSLFFAELFADPHYAQLFTAFWRQFNRTRYASVFGELSTQLSPAAFASFQDLLVQKFMADLEVDSIMEWQAQRGTKTKDFSEYMKVKTKVAATFDDEIKQTYGEETLNRLRTFESGTGARQDLLDRLAARLSYSAAPLDQEQAGRLAELYNAAMRAPDMSWELRRNSFLTDEFAVKALSILKPEQVTALKQVQAELLASRGPVSSVTIRPAAPPSATPSGGK